MKIGVASDVHLEFGQLNLKNDQGVDVLVLSGDIATAKEMDYSAGMYGDMRHSKQAARYMDFFRQVSNEFPHVVYVVGNHEHYNFDFKFTVEHIKRQLEHLDNVYVLEREVKKIDDVFFVGGTMWTDMNKRDPLTLFHVKSMMNDFRIIRNSNRYTYRKVPVYDYNEDGSLKKDENGYSVPIGMKMKEEPSTFSPEDAADEFDKFVGYLKTVTGCLGESDQKYVVCTHHTPSHKSCHEMYKHDTLMNGAYHSNLEDFILDRPQIKLWTHGHTHEDFDYMIGDTRVVCNPRGYIKYESRATNWKLKVIEV